MSTFREGLASQLGQKIFHPTVLQFNLCRKTFANGWLISQNLGSTVQHLQLFANHKMFILVKKNACFIFFFSGFKTTLDRAKHIEKNSMSKGQMWTERCFIDQDSSAHQSSWWIPCSLLKNKTKKIFQQLNHLTHSLVQDEQLDQEDIGTGRTSEEGTFWRKRNQTQVVLSVFLTQDYFIASEASAWWVILACALEYPKSRCY